MARTIRLVIALLVPTLWMLGCPFQPYYPDGPSGSGGMAGSSSSSATGGAGGMTASSSSSSGMPCATVMECDDNEPCTTDTCSNGQCVHKPESYVVPPSGEDPCFQDACVNGESVRLQLPAETPCGSMGSPAACDANGDCVGCIDKSDCPADTECRTYACDANKKCVSTSLPSSTMLPDNVVGDCHKPVCDGAGNLGSAFEPMDVPADDGNDCTLDACDMVSMLPVHPNKVSGSDCAPNGGDVCDGAGNCVECVADSDCTTGMNPSCDLATHTCISCSDSIQNGTETGLDCGGACPKRCDGTACTGDAQCKSGHCADGVCCESTCTTTCKACNVPGHEGTCTTLSAGLQDPGKCEGSNACDGTSGGGSCDALNNKKTNGNLCTLNSDCFNNTCAAGLCRLPTGQPCSDDVQCASLRCSNNVCTDCVGAGDCAATECNNGRCKAPNGTPCGINADCKTGSICNSLTTGLCGQAAGACNGDQDCESYNCANNSCSPCTNMTDAGTASDPSCASSTCLLGGVCALPLGAYCVGNSDCASQSCVGFPKKCQ